MLYKMYKVTYKEPFQELEEDDSLEYFNKLYEENDIEMVGEWVDADDPKVGYLITAYKNEDHYNDFIQKTSKDPKYRELTSNLSDARESVEVVNLRKPER